MIPIDTDTDTDTDMDAELEAMAYHATDPALYISVGLGAEFRPICPLFRLPGAN